MSSITYAVVGEQCVLPQPSALRVMRGQLEKLLGWILGEGAVKYGGKVGLFSAHTPKGEALMRAYLYLVEIFQYPMNKIDVRVKISIRHRADMVVYSDDAKTKPFLVVEGAAIGSSAKRLDAALQKAIYNAKRIGAPLAAVMSGAECIAVRFDTLGKPVRMESLPSNYDNTIL